MTLLNLSKIQDTNCQQKISLLLLLLMTRTGFTSSQIIEETYCSTVLGSAFNRLSNPNFGHLCNTYKYEYDIREETGHSKEVILAQIKRIKGEEPLAIQVAIVASLATLHVMYKSCSPLSVPTHVLSKHEAARRAAG